MSACGAVGPSMVAFLKEVYGRAKEADKFLMSRQPAQKHSWNTMVASSFWDMCLSTKHINATVPVSIAVKEIRGKYRKEG